MAPTLNSHWGESGGERSNDFFKQKSEFNEVSVAPTPYGHLAYSGGGRDNIRRGTNSTKRAQRPLCTAIGPIMRKIRERAMPTWHAKQYGFHSAGASPTLYDLRAEGGEREKKKR